MNNLYSLNIKQNKDILSKADRLELSKTALKVYDYIKPSKGHIQFRLLNIAYNLNLTPQRVNRGFEELCRKKILNNYSLI